MKRLVSKEAVTLGAAVAKVKAIASSFVIVYNSDDLVDAHWCSSHDAVNGTRSNTRAHSPAAHYRPSPGAPIFLPPSHYAAAGGFTFPSRHAQQSSAESDGIYRPVEVPSSPDVYIQVSQPDPDSSVDQMMNLPLVETRLLPSLRDTIDKMTRPPSRAANTHAASSPPSILSRAIMSTGRL
ncbi:uncharacterized protein BT62DRAFT_1013029 [Guyanagaster necrorhizus]|uniref:Uncharacterized protein n=1 Tax=Guyanagaster necrorhizus TaxID=856835 RepID=A0A9P8ALE7_9AGAR|nr:uncharacterized protein BT62DRAFT_1013029 [Guyanagaster necrorhizus MCA 3950]KAG7440118.1 hypothetical protein BT62DRAFT_1013029 [Guyanagaster necrorhizus MCA 3950]